MRQDEVPLSETCPDRARGQRRTVANISTATVAGDFLARKEFGLTGNASGFARWGRASHVSSVSSERKAVHSCLMFAVQADGDRWSKPRGLSPPAQGYRRYHQAFHHNNALQCGFCNRGQMLSPRMNCWARTRPPTGMKYATACPATLSLYRYRQNRRLESNQWRRSEP